MKNTFWLLVDVWEKYTLLRWAFLAAVMFGFGLVVLPKATLISAAVIGIVVGATIGMFAGGLLKLGVEMFTRWRLGLSSIWMWELLQVALVLMLGIAAGITIAIATGASFGGPLAHIVSVFIGVATGAVGACIFAVPFAWRD